MRRVNMLELCHGENVIADRLTKNLLPTTTWVENSFFS